MSVSIAVALAAVAGLFVPALAFAQSTPAPESAAIPPVVWELRSMNVGADPFEPPDPAAYTAQFLPDGELLVQADCNRGIGDFALDGDSIAIGPIGLTRMGCPEGSRGVEFVDLLSQAVRWSYRDDLLVLELPADAGSLAFAPALSGVVWEWQGFQGGNGAVVAPEHPAAYTIAFEPGGTLALQADCNRGEADWTADPPAIRIKPGTMTLIGCESGSLDGEFLAGLEQASSFVFRDGRLFLALPMDAGIHAFAAAVPGEAASPTAG